MNTKKGINVPVYTLGKQ